MVRVQHLERLAVTGVWRHPDFPRFYAGATFARVSNEMFPVAVVLLILHETGSAALAGGAVAALTFPSLVTGPILGAFLDRSERPFRLLALDQLISAAAFLALIWAVQPGAEAVIAVSLAAGIAFPLTGGGFTSILSQVTRPERLPAAVSLEAANFHVAIIVGPVLAGTVAAVVGPWAAVALQAALKLVAFALVVSLAPLRRETAHLAASVGSTVVLGVRHVVRTGPLLAVTVAGAVSLGGRGLLTVAFPLYAVDALGEERAFAGYLWAAFAAGSVLGIAAGAGRHGGRESGPAVMAGIAAQGLAMLVWPLAERPAVGLALVALAGALYGPALAATIAARQAWTPEGLRGQVFTTSVSVKPGTFALGAALAGPLVTALGPSGTILVAAGVQLLAAAAGAVLLWRRGRD